MIDAMKDLLGTTRVKIRRKWEVLETFDMEVDEEYAEKISDGRPYVLRYMVMPGGVMESRVEIFEGDMHVMNSAMNMREMGTMVRCGWDSGYEGNRKCLDLGIRNN